jgi:hypothetical protein
MPPAKAVCQTPLLLIDVEALGDDASRTTGARAMW